MTRRSRVQFPLGPATFFFMKIGSEVFSMVILPLVLIQEGKLLVSGERMYKVLVNCLKGQSLPVKMWSDKLTGSTLP